MELDQPMTEELGTGTEDFQQELAQELKSLLGAVELKAHPKRIEGIAIRILARANRLLEENKEMKEKIGDQELHISTLMHNLDATTRERDEHLSSRTALEQKNNELRKTIAHIHNTLDDLTDEIEEDALDEVWRDEEEN